MPTHANSTQESQSTAVADTVAQKMSNSRSDFQFEDNRPEAIQMRKFQETARSYSQKNALQFVDNRPEALMQRKLKGLMNNSPQSQPPTPFQKTRNESMAGQDIPIQTKSNDTGLPDNLKSGIETLSGYSMDDVKVHYNSEKPAQLNAYAYAQGTDIHLGAGQEKHLPHEAWHVVQQKQERVKPTMQLQDGINVNDDQGLEKEADVMGAKALQLKAKGNAIKVAAQRKIQQLSRYDVQDRQTDKTPSGQPVTSSVNGNPEGKSPTQLKKGGNKKPNHSNDDPIQRIIINTGEADLVTELRKEEGWIIASDIEVALQQGGFNQGIYELNQLGGVQIDANENIYLVGHGEEGVLGNERAQDISPAINAILPDDYSGVIRSLNCSSGAGGMDSGVVGLARRMVQKTMVIGANGIALNHPVYPGGTRVIPEDKWDEAEPIIDEHIEAVHDEWTRYVADTGITPALFKLDAVFASLISETFYIDLERELERHHLLIPTDRDGQFAQRV